MIKKKSERTGNIEVDLTGPEGNAFILMGYAEQWAKQLGYDWDEIHTELQEDDYDHLVSVMNKRFGHFVTFFN